MCFILVCHNEVKSLTSALPAQLMRLLVCVVCISILQVTMVIP